MIATNAELLGLLRLKLGLSMVYTFGRTRASKAACACVLSGKKAFHSAFFPLALVNGACGTRTVKGEEDGL
jgi:hypothetical protein